MYRMATTSERIKLARTTLGLTQEEFGKLAGVSKQAVSQWERGLTLPERDALLSLRRRKGISPEWITNGTGEMIAINENDELAELWGRLLPDERAAMLEQMRQRARLNEQHQQAMEALATRTVSVPERRKAQVPYGLPFDRRKKHGAQET